VEDLLEVVGGNELADVVEGNELADVFGGNELAEYVVSGSGDDDDGDGTVPFEASFFCDFRLEEKNGIINNNLNNITQML
jgi:hypothetical protein